MIRIFADEYSMTNGSHLVTVKTAGATKNTSLPSDAELWFKGLTKLNPPNIILSTSFVGFQAPLEAESGYAIYVNGVKRATTTYSSYDLSQLGLASGTYYVKVIALANANDGHANSQFSNTVTYIKN